MRYMKRNEIMKYEKHIIIDSIKSKIKYSRIYGNIEKGKGHKNY